MKKKAKKAGIENVEAIVHDVTRRNIPTAEYVRRNRDLDRASSGAARNQVPGA